MAAIFIALAEEQAARGHNHFVPSRYSAECQEQNSDSYNLPHWGWGVGLKDKEKKCV